MPELQAGQSGAIAAGGGAGLGADQQKALELLLTGQSMAQTATAVGISRTTLYRWLRHDAAFAAAYNQWQDQVHESTRARLLAMSGIAMAAVEKALEDGDARVAMQILKGMGLLSAKPVGLTDAEEIRDQTKVDREKRRTRRDEDRWFMKESKKMLT